MTRETKRRSTTLTVWIVVTAIFLALTLSSCGPEIPEKPEVKAVPDTTDPAEWGKLYPVEYKKGKLGKWVNDQVQLCAQALALEETLAVPVGSIGRGYLYYFGSARRDEVELGLGLRQQTLTLLAEAKLVATLPLPPPPIDSKRKCRDCSLEPLCLPREVLAMRAGKVRRDGDLLSD